MLKPLFIGVSLLAALFFSGCKERKASAEQLAPVQSRVSARKILNVGNGAEPQFLDPQLGTGLTEHALTRALFEGLVAQAPEGDDPVPGVAERWEKSDDGLIYTFHLRSDAKWSDGKRIDAQDFVASYRRMLTPSLAAEYVYMLFVVKGAEDYYSGKLIDFGATGFHAPDDRTLVITLRKPTPFFLRMLVHEAWFPVPLHVISKFGDPGKLDQTWTRVSNFVGNGPFRMTAWLPNQKIVTERSPTYWDRGHVLLDEIDFHAVELAETEERMFRGGQLDITYQVPLTKIAAYRKNNPESLRIDPWCGTYFYRFNLQRKPLGDVRVRRALSLAVERERLVENVTLGGETSAYALVPPNIGGYISQHHLEGNIAEAKQLLAEAGYPDGHGFPHLDILYNNLEKHRVIAEALQEMWRRNLGIDVGLRNEEWKVYLADQTSIAFDIERAGWIADYVDPHVFFDLWQTRSLNNDTHWSSPEYDRLLDSALDAKTDDARYAVYQNMERILVDELPILPLFFYTEARLVSPKVLHFKTTLLDSYPWKNVDLAP